MTVAYPAPLWSNVVLLAPMVRGVQVIATPAGAARDRTRSLCFCSQGQSAADNDDAPSGNYNARPDRCLHCETNSFRVIRRNTIISTKIMWQPNESELKVKFSLGKEQTHAGHEWTEFVEGE